MSKLELILLGQFDCLLPSGRRISLPMRKAEVLLAYLALTPGIRHPRERLINLLWSDRGEEQARNSLRQCLSAIRKSLGEAADLVLQVDRNTVCLNAELAEVDIHEFERLAAEGDYESLTTAADLYQGEFLEGISIRDPASQEWLDNERARFKRQFIEILSNLAETQRVSHDFKHAIQSAERLVKQDPLGESGWRLLMQSYFESGDRNHALQTFKRCQLALREELGVEPEAATVELREQIAAGNGAISRPIKEPTVKREKTNTPLADESVHSIAVLPFDNLSGDPEQEYFSDGITDSIILNLSLFPGLNVKSRNSSFAFKEQIKSLGEISRELGVDYIVEGSIRKSGERIRITVQLIETASGNQVWGKRYDAEIDDLFDLEEDLSRTIAATVTGQIESDLQRIALAKGAADQQAYDLLLSGIYHFQRFNREDMAIAIDKLNQCLEKDPDNVRAHILLYEAHAMNYLGRWSEDHHASFELGETHIRRALELDPDFGPTQVFFGEFLTFDGKLDEAALHLDKALDINPNDTDALAVKAMNLQARCRFEDALAVAERALRLDPRQPWAEWEVAGSQYFCGRYEAALETVSKFRTSPGFTLIFGIAANVKLGRAEASREALQLFLRDCSESMLSMPQTIDEWYAYTRENYPFVDPRKNQDLVDCLVEAGLAEADTRLARSAESGVHSIAVLPFDNLSGDPAQEYFSDGITESIILNLSLFPGLNVKSRNSSFAFKQQIKSLGDISRELEVDYIVEGSIRKTDDRVRVTVQLVDATSGNQVWGKRYDAEIENLFDLEEELSRTIATTVTGQIESDLRRIAMAKGAAHQQSYDLLLQGIYHSKKSSAPDTVIAVEKLHQCLELDPGNALAHATLYGCHEMNWIDRWAPDFEASRKLCKEHASKALELNPELGQAQVVYAEYLIFNREYGKAETHLKRALEINPNDSEAIAAVALNLSCQGQFEAALEQARLALRLDPYHTWARWILTESLFFCGLDEEVLETVDDTGNPPGFIQIYKIAANIRLGRMDMARDTLQSFLQHCRESMASMPRTIDEWLAYSCDNAPFADSSNNERIIDYLLQAGLEDEISPRSAAGSENHLPSVLVLPFSNLSGDPEQAYFSDGITDSIIVSLSGFDGLQVKSRHTSNAFRDSPKSIDEIGAELGVQYIVEGSVRKLGDNVRITVQLDDTGSGDQVWGKRFESELENLFSIEEELVQTIAGTISGRIGKELKSASLHKPAKDLKSYDYLLRGIYHLEKYNHKDSLIAQRQFQKCLEHDPDNAEAHAYLGAFYCIEIYENWSPEREESKRLMLTHAEKAIELEPDNAYAHAYLAEALMMHHEFERAEVHVNRAIELNPAMPDGYAIKGFVMGSTRRYAEAIENAEISLKIDPHHPYMAWSAGEVFRVCGQYERAVKTFRSMPRSPPSVHAQTAAALAGLDKIDEAKTEMNRYLESAHNQMPGVPNSESEWRTIWHDTMPYQYDEDAATLFELLLKAGLCDDLPDLIDDMPSIAVLPFENMSGDSEQEYFSDGVTTSVVLSLGLFKGMLVKSQQTSFAYKDSAKSSTEIAGDLKVDYLVEGGIRKAGNRVRVSVQLIESESGNQIWGKQYDTELEDILALEQELSQTIAATISGQIGHTLQQSAARKSATNLKSYDYLLRGLYRFGRFTAEDLVIARREFEKCLEIDPDNATAHTQLAELLGTEVLENWVPDIAEWRKIAGRHFETALSLEPDNFLTHSYYGEHLLQIGNNKQAEFHADRAIELNPAASEGYWVKAEILGMTRRFDEAIHYAEMSLQLDPLSIGAAWILGDIYCYGGQYEKAIKVYLSIAHPPASTLASIAASHAGLGKIEEAKRWMLRYLEQARREMPNLPRDETAWRDYWRSYWSSPFDEEFETYFGLLLTAGLCQYRPEGSNDMPSIAVLPFENMSGDPEQEHFADGITADIISTLSNFPHLRTISRYSTLQYKTDKPSIAGISKEQNARYLLEGSVRKSGNRIRVSAELIDSTGEKICWSERYDRDLDDLFAVQDELTRQIALAMKVHLDDGEKAVHRSKGATSIKAWELVMTAADLQDTHIRQHILDGRAMAEQAIALDPNYAYAWVTLGWSYWQEAYNGWSDRIDQPIEQADKANRQAMSLDPDYGEVWSLAGMIHQMKHEAAESIDACRKAVELEPGSAEVHALTAWAYIVNGEYEQARQYDHNMRILCPVRPAWYYLVSGGIEQRSGNLEKAIEIYQQSLEAEPDSPLGRFYLIDAMMEIGDEASARILADEIRALDNSVNGRGLVHTFSYDESQRQRFHDNLAKFDLV